MTGATRVQILLLLYFCARAKIPLSVREISRALEIRERTIARQLAYLRGKEPWKLDVGGSSDGNAIRWQLRLPTP